MDRYSPTCDRMAQYCSWVLIRRCFILYQYWNFVLAYACLLPRLAAKYLLYYWTIVDLSIMINLSTRGMHSSSIHCLKSVNYNTCDKRLLNCTNTQVPASYHTLCGSVSGTIFSADKYVYFFRQKVELRNCFRVLFLHHEEVRLNQNLVETGLYCFWFGFRHVLRRRIMLAARVPVRGLDR